MQLNAVLDPHAHLESIDSQTSLDWVEQKNTVTRQRITNSPRFNSLNEKLFALQTRKDRLPGVNSRGPLLYNFWQDEAHPKGRWRTTTRESYMTDTPVWDILLDIDELAKVEGKDWVWGGATGLYPDYNRFLIQLSIGGSDATIIREWDRETKSFVKDGFFIPEAKGGADWLDKNTLLISSTAIGPISESGYPLQVSKLKRGQDLADAEELFTANATHLGAFGSFDQINQQLVIEDAIDFQNNNTYLLLPEGLKLLPLPTSAEIALDGEWCYIELKENDTLFGSNLVAGQYIVVATADLFNPQAKFTTLYMPTKSSSLADVSGCKDYLFLHTTEHVQSRVRYCRIGEWVWTEFPVNPGEEVSLDGLESDLNNEVVLTRSGFLLPTTQFYSPDFLNVPMRPWKSMPQLFDGDAYEVHQHFATSEDGTKIPYHIVHKKGIAYNGTLPTLIYGYGGFEVSLSPFYLASVEHAWLSQGGAFVQAYLRGGGEYGPQWHRSAIRKNKLRSYADCAAVAQDLIQRNITAPKHLAVKGGSNGGLLVGNMVTRYPHLFKAAICAVPLLDMKVYHKLLAGASWMAEYGNPDNPKDWDFMQRFSPYHNLKEDTEYPVTLFTTSTRDDRVHPGHARKMAAKMDALGIPNLFFENTNGGHGGAADAKMRAYISALEYTFLMDQLTAR